MTIFITAEKAIAQGTTPAQMHAAARYHDKLAEYRDADPKHAKMAKRMHNTANRMQELLSNAK